MAASEQGRTAARRATGRLLETVADEPLALALTPIINLVLIVTAGLLLVAGWVTTRAAIVTAPRIGGTHQAAARPVVAGQPLALTLVITDQGFYLATSGRVLGANLTDTAVARGPTVPRRDDGAYDFAGLTEKLAVIKDAFPEENRIVITAEPEIGYGVLMQAMDAARLSSQRGELFPEVVLSADLG